MEKHLYRQPISRQAYNLLVGLFIASFCFGTATAQCLINVSTSYQAYGLYTYNVQITGPYALTVKGADGGNGGRSNIGGQGSTITGNYTLQAGDVLTLIIGQRGGSSSARIYASGGGGGSAIVLTRGGNTPLLLLAAGGGGGVGDGSGFDGDAPGGGGQGLLTSTNGGSGQNGAGGGGLASGGGGGSGTGGGQAILGGISSGGSGNGNNGGGGDGFGGGGSGGTQGADDGGGGGGGGGGGTGGNRYFGGTGGFCYADAAVTAVQVTTGLTGGGSQSDGYAMATVTATSTPPTPFVATQQTSDGLVVQISGGVQYERLKTVDRINGYEIRQTEQNQTGYFLIRESGPYSITVIGANGCRTVVTGTR